MTKDYEVGYGKPPARGQFKPGQSGNPKGRPKGTLNLKTDVEQELKEKILISEGGQRHKVSKQRGMVKALTAKALKGDVRAATVLIGLIGKFFEEELVEQAETPLQANDLQIIQQFLERQVRDEK